MNAFLRSLSAVSSCGRHSEAHVVGNDLPPQSGRPGAPGVLMIGRRADAAASAESVEGNLESYLTGCGGMAGSSLVLIFGHRTPQELSSWGVVTGAE